MAKDNVSDIENVVKVITSKSVDERVASLVRESKGEFPEVSEIELSEPYVDVFKPPKWCDTEKYAYAWVDPRDEVQIDRSLNWDHWQIVTRSNHPKAFNADFRAHGAVERRGMILVYRPIELERRLRFLGEKRHHEAFAAQREPVKGDQWERSLEVGKDVPSTGFRPVVGEEKGKTGIVDKSAGQD